MKAARRRRSGRRCSAARRPSGRSRVINRNLWALAALPLIFAAGQVSIKVTRIRLGFYVYYPAHLAVLWAMVRLL